MLVHSRHTHVKPLCCFVAIFTITLKVFELLLSGNVSWGTTTVYFRVLRKSVLQLGLWGWGILPYKGVMGTCGQPGYVFRFFVLNRVLILSFFS